jgi:hypothetical protein
MTKYVRTEKHFYINIKYLLEINKKAYRYVVQNFFTRIQPKVLNGERFVDVQSLMKFPSFLRKQLVEDFDKKGDKLTFTNKGVDLQVKDKKVLEYAPKVVTKEPEKNDETENTSEEIVNNEQKLQDSPQEENLESENKEPEIPEYDISMLKKELIEIAETNGVDIDSNDTKADIVSKLDEKFGK